MAHRAEDRIDALRESLDRLGSMLARVDRGRAAAEGADVVDEMIDWVEAAARTFEPGASAAPPAKRDARESSKSPESPDAFEVLRGHSRAVSLPELLTFIASSYKRGLLRLHTAAAGYLIQVETGSVVDVRCDHLAPGEDLVRILAETSDLDAAEVERVCGAHAPRERGEDALLAAGLVTSADLRRARTEQALLILRRMLSAVEAEFWFYSDARSTIERRVELDITTTLLDSARASDEAVWRKREEAEARAAETGPEPGHPAAASVDERLGAELLRDLETGRIKLPLLDSSTCELIALCWDEAPDLRELQERISADLTLCAHLLRIANSSAYAPRVPITSVQLAIARLGLHNIREAVLALTVRNRVFDVPEWNGLVRSIWRRAALRSGYAQAIDKAVHAGSVKGSMVGLLLDIGKPVALGALLDAQDRLGVSLDVARATLLVEKLSPEVGARVIREWSLPAWLEDVIRLQRTPEWLGDHRTESWIAHLADRLARWAEDPDPAAVEELFYLPESLELSLRPEAMRAILERTEEIKRRASAYA